MLVYLRRSGRVTPAQFEECVVDELTEGILVGQDTNEIYVEYEVTDTGMKLEASTCDKKQSIPLCRPPFCPIKLLDAQMKTAISAKSKSGGIKIGVAILLESCDNCVLITRRSKTMRTFPGVWVPPGGHLERGETLLQAGLREMEEETGIQVEEYNTNVLGFWESVYPPKLEMGPPRRHHIVAYLHVKSRDTAAELISKMTLAQEETDACAWLCSCFTYRVVKTNDGLRDYILSSKNCASSPGFCTRARDRIEGISIGDDGVRKGRIIAADPLLQNTDNVSNYERISTGTIYALEQWLVTTSKCQNFNLTLP